MKTRNIPLDQIQVPPVRITAVYNEELREQLGLSLGQAGQLEPIIVVQSGESYILVDGLHRLEEAQRRGEKDIAAVIHQGDAASALLYNVASSRLRGKVSLANLIEVISYMTGTLNLDSDQIAKTTGMTRDYIEKLWRVAEACEEVLDAVQREAIGLGVAHEIARLPHPDQQRLVLGVVEKYKTPVKLVKAQVDEVLQLMQTPAVEPQPMQPSAPPVFTCEGCGNTIDPAMLRAAMVCPGCFGEMYAKRKGIRLPPPSTASVPSPTVGD